MGPGNVHWCKTYLQDIQDLMCTQVEVELFQNIKINNIQHLFQNTYTIKMAGMVELLM